MTTYEAWVEEDEAGNVTEVTFAPLSSIVFQKQHGLLSVRAKMLYRFDAASWEEGMSIHHLRMGFEPYNPHDASVPCSKCGAHVYASGQCWKCGEGSSDRIVSLSKV